MDQNRYTTSETADVIEEMFSAHKDELYRYLTHAIGDGEEAKDLLQETFIRAIKGLPGYRNDASYRTWLFTLARTSVADHLRRKRRRERLLIGRLGELLPLFDKRTVDPSIHLEGIEESHQLWTVLRSLKQDYKDVIILRIVCDLTVDETASSLGWSNDTVTRKLHRALKTLRKRVRGHDTYIQTEHGSSFAGRERH
ncbi:RNA polymerase sigma factor [Alicyclobacillus sp. SP_1]|uniref:RNA polymerase sigma factor n=1 Tax=Alicyclobacillus sp. SP_1 TaxID=2942475 RepID=UPI00215804CE|nr:sigma-70 family RNA polymerase sigma factor [Alicyclobacillus sp. SP_1]